MLLIDKIKALLLKVYDYLLLFIIVYDYLLLLVIAYDCLLIFAFSVIIQQM